MRWLISHSCPYFRNETTYVHTHTLCSYKIYTSTSEQQVNFYCLQRNVKKHTYFFSATVIIYCKQSPDRLAGPALGLCKCINLLFTQGSPRQATALRIQSHKQQTEEKDHFPGPPGYTFTHATQDVPSLPHCHDSLAARTHIQMVVHHNL